VRAEPTWIQRDALDAIHQELIRRDGGLHGVRDEGLLDSALARPQNKLAYEPESDLAALAASYGMGLAKNHAYLDGNKRIAFMAMYVFLGLNGWELEVPEPEAVLVMLEVASGVRDEASLGEWLRTHLVEMPDDLG
jgi:death on curing protein